RTPMIGKTIREFLPWKHLLSYLDCILRVYNQEGSRDNKFKARIKILVKELGADVFRDRVEALFELEKDGPSTLTEEEVARCRSFFTDPPYEDLPDEDPGFEAALRSDLMFAHWVERSVHPHKK